MSAPTPQSGENHTAVLWLIRGSLVLFASFLLLILGLIVAGALAQAAHYFQNPPVHGDPFSSVAPIGGVLVGVGLIIVIPCFLVNWVRRLSRKKAELPRTEGLLKVDANSV